MDKKKKWFRFLEKIFFLDFFFGELFCFFVLNSKFYPLVVAKKLK